MTFRRTLQRPEKMTKEFRGVLLSHRSKFWMAFADERLEVVRSDTFLEGGRAGWFVGGEGTRDGVATGEETIGDLAHLAFDAVGRVFDRTGEDVSGKGKEVASRKVGQGEDGLQDRSHITAVRRLGKRMMDEKPATRLLPRLRMPVRAGPASGSSSLPSSPVIAKSNLRFCSTCCAAYHPLPNTEEDSSAPARSCSSPSSSAPPLRCQSCRGASRGEDRVERHYRDSSRCLRARRCKKMESRASERTSSPFRLDRAQLDGDRVTRLLVVCQAMTIAARSAKLLSPATESPASETEPQIAGEFASYAVSETGGRDVGRGVLNERAGVIAGFDLLFPRLDFRLLR